MKKIDTIGDWIRQTSKDLTSISDTPQLEAQVIAAHVIGKSRTWILSHLDLAPEKNILERLYSFIAKRMNGTPLPYLLGKWEFFNLDFYVSADVLIPRPETELLVTEAISWLKSSPDSRFVADAGTGSGCIAVSLAVNIHSINICCTDISYNALQIAKENTGRHHCSDRLFFIQTDLLSSVVGKFDLICANLPYIPTSTLVDLPVRHFEPLLALDGGSDGLSLIRRLLNQTQYLISPNGLILFEIESGQSELALKLANDYFPNSKNEIINDLAGLPRLLRIEV